MVFSDDLILGISTIRHLTNGGVSAPTGHEISASDKLRQYEFWRHVLGRIVRSHKEERAFVAAALTAAKDPLRWIEMFVNVWNRGFDTRSRRSHVSICGSSMGKKRRKMI